MIDSDEDYTIYYPNTTLTAICKNKRLIINKDISRINTYNGQTINFIISISDTPNTPNTPNTQIVIKKDGIEYINDIINVGEYKFSYFAEKSARFLVQIGSNIDIINFKIKVYKFKFIYDFAIWF
jgi:hypothetical protein